MDNRIYNRSACLFILVAFLFVASSCTENKNRTVDQQYLDSQEYSSFKENADSEIQSSQNDSENIGEDLVAIAECTPVQTFAIPVSFEWNDIEEHRRQSSDCEKKSESITITLFGQQEWSNMVLRWYLLERQSAYRDAEVIVATFDGNKLRSFRSVGLFEKIPARSVSTTITVNERNNVLFIRSETNRDIEYPLDQENIIVTEFEVDADGGINEL